MEKDAQPMDGASSPPSILLNLVGCAVFLIVGILVTSYLFITLIEPELSFSKRVFISFGTLVSFAVVAPIAAWILSLRDRQAFNSKMQDVRRRLLRRENVDDLEFMTHFPEIDSILLTDTRAAIGRFFNVLPLKIHPADNLRKDLEFDAFSPGFHYSVVCYVLESHQVAVPDFFDFNTAELSTIGDLAEEIQRLINRIKGSPPKKPFLT